MRILFFLLAVFAMPAWACSTSSSNANAAGQAKSNSQLPVVQDAAVPVRPAVETLSVPETVTALPTSIEQNVEKKSTPVTTAVSQKSNPVVESGTTPVETTAPSLILNGSQPVEKQTVTSIQAEPVSTENPGTPPAPSHETWDQLLQQYVSAAGKVNYAGFKKDKARLESYLDVLQKHPPQESWSRSEKMAYWINAYNAFTIKLIVDNYPISSIMKLDGGKTWDVKRISIGGKNYSLNNIENDILRSQFKDARIHFAVNCAAKSCPPLLNRAWTAANLESNFEKQARAFINNANFNKISAKEVEVSKIFEWYAADFGNLIAYLNKYSNTKINTNAKIKFREYDWNLNE